MGLKKADDKQVGIDLLRDLASQASSANISAEHAASRHHGQREQLESVLRRFISIRLVCFSLSLAITSSCSNGHKEIVSNLSYLKHSIPGYCAEYDNGSLVSRAHYHIYHCSKSSHDDANIFAEGNNEFTYDSILDSKYFGVNMGIQRIVNIIKAKDAIINRGTGK